MTTLYAQELGNPNGEPIVFLHGAGVAGWMWQEIAAQLDDFRSILIDLPGHANSAHITVKSLEEMADLVAADIDTRFDGQAVNIVGLSLGGMMVTLLTSRHPHLVKRGLASGVNALPIKNGWYFRILANLMTGIMKRDFYIKFNAKLFGVTENEWGDFYSTSKKLNMDVFKVIVNEALNFRIPANFSQIEVPMLFVAGAKENQTNIESVEALAEAFSNSIGVIAPEGSHMWSAEQPELFANMVRAWLTDTPLPDELVIKVGQDTESMLIAV